MNTKVAHKINIHFKCTLHPQEIRHRSGKSCLRSQYSVHSPSHGCPQSPYRKHQSVNIKTVSLDSISRSFACKHEAVAAAMHRHLQ